MALTKVTSGVISSDASSIDLNIDAGTLYIDASANKVGIQTTSPDTPLDVEGSGGIRVNEDGSGTKIINLRSDFAGVGPAVNVSSNHPLLLMTNNTERVRVDSSGNVGIGTSSSNQDGFDANATVLSVKSANNGEGVLELIGGGNSSGDQISVINFMSQAAGNPAGQITALRGNADDESAITFHTSGAERMRMSTTGDLTIGTTSATSSIYNGAGSAVGHGLNGATGYAAHVRGGANTPLYVSHSGTGNGTYIHFYQSTTGRGFISQSGGSTLYNASSDYRLKENVVDLENATSRINSLRPVNFDWIESGENSDGFIAHEAQSIVPYAVEGTHNEVYTAENSLEEQEDLLGTPKYQAMDYGKLTPLLVKALQEANAKIEALETRIETLENA